MTHRYQYRTLEDGWNETVNELKLDVMPLAVVDAMHKAFLIGAVFVATHKRDSEALLEEALEVLEV